MIWPQSRIYIPKLHGVNMHTAVKIMLILGTLTTVGGIIIMAVGARAVADVVDYDPTVDAEWEGKTGTFNDDISLMYSVYSSASSCDSITVTILDGDGDSAIETYECDDSTQSEDGYIYLGLLASTGPYTVDSTETVYISEWGEELEVAAGGFFAIVASWGVICCGVFMLILGGIFALTITEPSMIVVNQAGMPMQQGQMMAAQYPQPVQQQVPMQQQYAQQPVQQQPVQQSPFGQPPVQQQPAQQSPFDQQPPQGGF